MKDQTEVVSLFPFDGIITAEYIYAGWLLMMVVLVSLETTSTMKVALGTRGEGRKKTGEEKGRKGVVQ